MSPPGSRLKLASTGLSKMFSKQDIDSISAVPTLRYEFPSVVDNSLPAESLHNNKLNPASPILAELGYDTTTGATIFQIVEAVSSGRRREGDVAWTPMHISSHCTLRVDRQASIRLKEGRSRRTEIALPSKVHGNMGHDE
ncbi:MAG: hypothetical protein Q9176_004482 [Flavoplaca citrina]